MNQQNDKKKILSVGQLRCGHISRIFLEVDVVYRSANFIQNVGAFKMNKSSSSFLIQLSNLLTNVMTALLSMIGSNVAYNS